MRASAATAIGYIRTMLRYYRENSAIVRDLDAEDVGHVAAFLASSMGTGITGTVIYVDNGYHAMGMPQLTPDADDPG